MPQRARKAPLGCGERVSEERRAMNLYEPRQLADGMRVVRKNTIAIAEDIPEAQFDYRPVPHSRSVRETLLHMASMTFFDFHIREEERRTSMEGFDFRGFFAELRTYEKG